jgi:hypothetical protein
MCHLFFRADPADDKEVSLDGNPVTIPMGLPKAMPDHDNSAFTEAEYVIYLP